MALHIIADAPSPNWVKIEVPFPALWCPFISPMLVLESAVHPKGCYIVDTRNPAILSLPLPAPNISHCQPKHTSFHTSSVRIRYTHPIHRFDLQPCMPNTCTRRQYQNVFRPGLFLPGPRKRRRKTQADRSPLDMYYLLILIKGSSMLTVCAAERTAEKDPSLYLLTLEQMIENDYPIPSYMADIFEKPPGWIETPEPKPESILALPAQKKRPRVYAIDCEMVGTYYFHPLVSDRWHPLVYDRRRQRAHSGLYHRLRIWRSCI